MIKNHRGHAAYQWFTQIREMERTPDLNREQHFLNGEMTRADRLARQVKELKIGEEEITQRLVKHSRRMERLRATLEHLHEMHGDGAPRSPAAVRRFITVSAQRHSEV